MPRLSGGVWTAWFPSAPAQPGWVSLLLGASVSPLWVAAGGLHRVGVWRDRRNCTAWTRAKSESRSGNVSSALMLRDLALGPLTGGAVRGRGCPPLEPRLFSRRSGSLDAGGPS